MSVTGAAPASGEWIGLVSGFDIGLDGVVADQQDSPDSSLQLMVEYLLGEAGGLEVGAMIKRWASGS